MEHNDRRDSYGDTFRIEVGQPARPLTAQRWFRLAMVLLGLAAIAGVVVYTQGDTFMASWYASRAESKASSGDYHGAIADISHAIQQTPDNIQLYLRRGQFRLNAEPPDLDGAIEDFDHVISVDPTFAEGYIRRSTAYQRMALLLDDEQRAAELHAAAIADLEKAQPHMPKDDPMLLNQLAYTRAVAGVDLDLALQEIETVLNGVDTQAVLATVEEEPINSTDILRAREILAYVDTRGYIQHLRGEQEAALKDMDLALDLYLATDRAIFNRLADENARAAFEREQEKLHAVLLHHRGLVHQALGNEAQAEADLSKAKELGYNPKVGVY